MLERGHVLLNASRLTNASEGAPAAGHTRTVASHVALPGRAQQPTVKTSTKVPTNTAAYGATSIKAAAECSMTDLELRLRVTVVLLPILQHIDLQQSQPSLTPRQTIAYSKLQRR